MTTQGWSPTLENCYALCDLPITILFRQLDTAYPGSKFILTVRDEYDWLRSVKNHWSHDTNQFRVAWDSDPFTHRIHKEVYGQKRFDESVMIQRYRGHNAEVLEYFRSRPKDLLVMDVDRGAGWQELCEFLDVPIPSTPYPRTYVTAEQDSRRPPINDSEEISVMSTPGRIANVDAVGQLIDSNLTEMPAAQGVKNNEVDMGEDGANPSGGDLRVHNPNGNMINETLQTKANGGLISLFSKNSTETVRLSSVNGAPDSGGSSVTNADGTQQALMTSDINGNSGVEADREHFCVSHPTQPETDSEHACLEGPEAAVYLRGTGRLVNGEATIPLPDHFVIVATPASMTVQVTPLSSDSLGLSVVAKECNGFIVKELHKGLGSYGFDWEVKCVREGHEEYQVTRPNGKRSVSCLAGLHGVEFP
jgi:hypothetical protein